MKYLLLAASVLALTACSKQGQVYRSYFGEAGNLINGGDFGNSTAHNAAVNQGNRNFVIDLTNKFASDVPSTVTFAFDSARLDANAQQVLRKQATWIRQFPEVRFRVYGHTDLVGSPGYNKNLGQRRANAAVNFLVSQGISRSRLEAVASFGETQPLVVTQGRERKNRRTVTEVSGFVESHPAVIDGKYAQVIQREYLISGKPASDLILVTEGATLTGDGE
ncbi:OmpA family protein [Roseovarius phycicola]|uniref:OmpA family protein n=1 Tax=Roseovarius phycicola TaxID=3080976 RepID=A0ABZ2HFJ1_9RHOB